MKWSTASAAPAVALGILPMGTVNVLAMELGIPFDLVSAWKVIRGGKVRLIDQASANGHLFVQMAGIGLDAQIVERNSRQIKKVLGPLSYLLTATQVAIERPPKLRVVSDHHARRWRVPSCWSVTADFTAAPSRFSSDADMQDGLLDVYVFRHTNYLALMRYLRGMVFGSLAKFTDVDHFKARQSSRRGKPARSARGGRRGRRPRACGIHRATAQTPRARSGINQSMS